METVLRVTALCLTGALLAVLLHRSGGEMALLLSLAVTPLAHFPFRKIFRLTRSD